MFKSDLVRTKCCICQKDQALLFLKVGGFNLVKCQSCNLIYVNPRYSTARLKKLYSREYFTGIGEKQFQEKYKIQVFKPIVDELIKISGLNNGKLLDVGTAAGWFLEVARKQGFSVQGIEPAAVASNFARKKNNLPVKTGTLLTVKLPKNSFDVLTMIGVIEHLSDPRKNLRKAYQLLKQNGWIMLSVPNIASLSFKIFKKGFVFIDPKVHLWYFSPQTITELLNANGFEVKKITYPYFKTPYFNLNELIRLLVNLIKKLITPSKKISSAAWYGNELRVYAQKIQKPFIKSVYSLKKIEQQTADLYAPLWENFNQKSFDESIALFGRRLKRNGFDLKWFKGKICLDAGCGGGRYAIAMALLHAKRVIGLDMNFRGLKNAQKRLHRYQGINAVLKHGSILDIPYPNNSFDFVCCNGVLHHTIDPDLGLSELIRVLKPGGTLFVYVYGKGGLMWMFVDFLRFIGKFVSFTALQHFMKLIKTSAKSQFHWLDLMYVPIQKRYSANEIKNWLKRKGLKNIRLLEKERYYREGHFQRLIYGEGDLRFLASKL